MSETSVDLKKMAETEKQEFIDASPEAPADPDTFTPLGAPVGVEALGGVGAPVIILPGEDSAPAAGIQTSGQIAPMPTLINPADFGNESSSEITEDDLRAVMPDVDDDTFMSLAQNMKMNLSKYQKALVINNGFTPEEALQAAKKKLEKDGTEENSKWLEDHPRLGEVVIDKTQEKIIKFSPEEKEKLSKVKSIHLVVCEDADLKTIPIKKLTKESKTQFLKTADFNLSKYAIPLPVYGDFVSFKGAQIVQLASAMQYEDSTLDETIGRKASLLYDRLIGGQVLVKYGSDNGKKTTDLNYSQFMTHYPFYDLDMGMFGILCASSAEEATTTLSCPSCKSDFEWKYNIKALLNMDEVSDKFKEIVDRIIGNKVNRDVLLEIHTEGMKTVRYKSPFSQHIYDISQPSIADAIKIYGMIDQEDKTVMAAAQLALFIRSMYLWSPEDESYIPINDDPTLDETDILLENIQSIPQTDVNMISNVGSEMIYIPRFILRSKCPACGREMTNLLKPEEMIFLAAQDSFTEMTL